MMRLQKKDKSFVMSEVSDHWCRSTNGETTETTFTWTIEDFVNRSQKPGNAIFSSKFLAKTPNKKESYWQMMFYPKGDEKSGDHLSIFLKSNNDFSLRAKFEVSILDSRSKKTRISSMVSNLFDSTNPAWGLLQWALRDPVINNPELLPEGHLTIFCVVAVYGPEETFSGTKDLEIKSRPKVRGFEQVIEQFGKLFDDQEFSDVKIECDGEIFNCHCAILSTRSDVFRAMFQADMTENRTKKVTIKDIDSEVVREMLHFIYTGGTNEDVLKKKAGELLAAAERYQLGVLKNICEDQLCANLQINNAVENLVFGDLHQANKLRKMAMKVIARNLVKVVETEEYQNLVKHHPSLAADIPMALVEDKMIKQ